MFDGTPDTTDSGMEPVTDLVDGCRPIMLGHVFTDEQLVGIQSALHQRRRGDAAFAERHLDRLLRRHGCSLADFDAHALNRWERVGIDDNEHLGACHALALDHCRGCADSAGQRKLRLVRLLPFSGPALGAPDDRERVRVLTTTKHQRWWRPWK